ncbi:epoxide hydrolase domain-containing protein [Gymnopilus junonius]|uniref:Epoxide hydrolase domain-containing protein n=1 Tax=Gymnopilus junonius TaxID=109634 RepID=A0A9P5TPB8_GYMJU|nr:epoxide hydrolase domain-containing protein [Gymnopilus junonius]
MTGEVQPQPFDIAVDSETLDWITQRVQNSRVVPDVKHLDGTSEWSDGVPSSVVNELVEYWKTSYDWRKVEARLNSTFKMFTLDIEEGDEVIKLHFVHHRSERPDAIPLLFAHGWPGNFTEVENLLGLTTPRDSAQQAFHIVAPTIPGFVFSSSPKASGFSIPRIGSVYHKLMLNLGYTKYIGQGGDWGSMILRSMAISYPDSCVGIHLNMIMGLPPSPLKNPLTLLWLVARWFTADEKKRLARMQWWMKEESGYSRIQGTKPQTVSYGLLDSPVGMLAWIREKLESLVQPGYVWDKELVITWAMFYLLSGSSWHARIYKEAIQALRQQVLEKRVPATVSFGASCFPYDVGYIPIWWAKATVAENIVFWKEHLTGGHFPSIECGDALNTDILDFVSRLSDSALLTLRSVQK